NLLAITCDVLLRSRSSFQQILHQDPLSGLRSTLRFLSSLPRVPFVGLQKGLPTYLSSSLKSMVHFVLLLPTNKVQLHVNYLSRNSSKLSQHHQPFLFVVPCTIPQHLKVPG